MEIWEIDLRSLEAVTCNHYCVNVYSKRNLYTRLMLSCNSIMFAIEGIWPKWSGNEHHEFGKGQQSHPTHAPSSITTDGVICGLWQKKFAAKYTWSGFKEHSRREDSQLIHGANYKVPTTPIPLYNLHFSSDGLTIRDDGKIKLLIFLIYINRESHHINVYNTLKLGENHIKKSLCLRNMAGCLQHPNHCCYNPW